MCGIAGLIATDAALIDRGVLAGMRDAIRYRGLDAEGEWIGDTVALCHARLKVIDLSNRADQPMADLGGRYRIVFNGEIYNYETLRAEYARLGARFASNSDTEVIVEGYRLKGPKVCEDLNGMFAFAIYDTLAQSLFLARDRLGKKPLYWARLDKCFAFASTIDAFRDLPGWQPDLSQSALLFYGITGAYPRGRTIYARAEALPPGCQAEVSLRNGLQPVVRRFWGLDFQRKEGRGLGALLEEYGTSWRIPCGCACAATSPWR